MRWHYLSFLVCQCVRFAGSRAQATRVFGVSPRRLALCFRKQVPNAHPMKAPAVECDVQVSLTVPGMHADDGERA